MGEKLVRFQEMGAKVWCDKKGRMLFRYMCDKLGEKTKTHFEGFRVGKLDGYRKMKREGRRGRKGGSVRIKERKLGNEMEKV
ncbi:hypothetical protein CUC00_12240 [Prevotella intermedia]|uniref:hypothetical protein n=1 Tax=Prevotella intermedia TaxID=28131 RepID=UPI000C1C1D07|nr:hypothetical protein [Prevotella intermedia]ATV41834.1 hypothetical protein CUC00_12240 [Prevotella intermedia]